VNESLPHRGVTQEPAREDRLKVAVIGVGFVGPHHVDAARRTGYADVVAVAGADRHRTAARAKELGVGIPTTDIDRLLGDPDIDVIHVCTPNRTHVEFATAVLNAGKHLVLEKPVAVDSASGELLVELAVSRNLRTLVTFTYRGYPIVQRARQLVADGVLGSPRLIHGAYLQDWLARATDFNWRVLEADGGPSRAVADIGSHWFDLAEFVSGRRVEGGLADFARVMDIRHRPVSGTATFSSSGGEETEAVAVTTEDAATLLLRFEGGARGACVVSQISVGHRNHLTLEIAGSDRSLAWDQEAPEHLWLGSGAHVQSFQRDSVDTPRGIPSLPAGHPQGWSDALRDVMRPFYAAIFDRHAVDDPSPYPTLADGVRAVQFTEVALASSQQGGWVAMPPVRKRDQAVPPS
jgi:predicted dehydrogenase